MALIIETGAGVEGANSFATVAELRAFAALRGLAVPTADSDCERLLVLACEYLDSLETLFKGSRNDAEQALSWPRAEVYLFGSYVAFSNSAIPSAIKNAQCQLAVDSQTVTLLALQEDTREIVREKVDVIETEYAPGGAQTPNLRKAYAFLIPVLKSVSSLKVSRA
jgi:hypothetical protein